LAHGCKFRRTVGRFVKQRYMLSVMCGRSTYKLTWEEIVPTHIRFEAKNSFRSQKKFDLAQLE
jgi:hypothetical protein